MYLKNIYIIIIIYIMNKQFLKNLTNLFALKKYIHSFSSFSNRFQMIELVIPERGN